jgi:LysM repeat protein
MKRLLLAAAALSGSLFFIPQVSAQAVENLPTTPSTVAPASGSPTKVLLTAVALPTYTVIPGDTLWAIGMRLGRTWQALASWNHVPNPNLIYAGAVLTVPPASYNGSGSVIVSTPVHDKYTYGVANGQVSTPVSHTSTYHVSASGGAPGSFQACVEFRESTDGAGSSDLYGIEPYIWTDVLGRAGSPYSASPAEQSAAFNQLYAMQGTRPWAPYDGC